MKNKLFRQVTIIIFLVALFSGTYYVAVPYYESLMVDALQKQIVLKTTTDDKKPIYLEANNFVVTTELAVTESEREKGLGNRTNLMPNAGMLFVFDKPDLYRVWMKDMLFPIDIIWLDQNLKVVDIKKSVSPNTYPTMFASSRESMYILEINSGISDKYGINIGTGWSMVDGDINI